MRFDPVVRHAKLFCLLVVRWFTQVTGLKNSWAKK